MDLLRARRDQKGDDGGAAPGPGLFHHVGNPGEVLVRRVGAGPDQGGGQLVGVSFGFHCGGHLGYRPRQVRSVGSDQVGLQGGEVDLDHPGIEPARVCLNLGVGGQKVAVAAGEVGQTCTVGSSEVAVHGIVHREDRGGCAQFCPHVGDSRLAGAGDGGDTGTEIFDHRIGPSFHRQDPQQLQDYIFGRSPTGQGAGKPDADDVRVLDLPGEPGHDVHGVGAADSGSEHSEAAGVRRMGIGADHHAAGKRIVLQDDLVDDAGPRLPEPEAVFRGGGLQEIVYLAVLVHGCIHVRPGALVGEDQMIAVHGGRHRNLRDAGLGKLEQGHLRSGVLQGDPIRVQLQVAFSGPEVCAGRIVQVAEKHFFRQGQRSSQPLPDDFQVFFDIFVSVFNKSGGAFDHGHHVLLVLMQCKAFEVETVARRRPTRNNRRGCDFLLLPWSIQGEPEV